MNFTLKRSHGRKTMDFPNRIQWCHHHRYNKAPLSVFIALLTLPLTTLHSSDASRPNILLIMADDLGWSDLGCYGNELIDTPHIDGLAKEGMRFTSAYAMPVCTPTRVSIQSGKNPATLKIQHPNPHNRPWAKLTTPRQYWRLPLEETTIAEALAENGYISYHVGKWGSGYSRQHQGYSKDPESYPEGPYAERVRQFEQNNPHKRIGLFLCQAVRFIEENQDRPFFCMFSPIQVHTGLEARSELIEKYNLRFSERSTSIHPIYAAMTETFDDSVGLLLEVLESLGLANNTLVLVCSDNGGVLNERGYVPGGWEELVTSNWPLRSEKGSLYEGGIRIPLIVRWPGKVEPGTESNEKVTCYDFFPTFCDLSGTAYDSSELDGISFRSVLKNKGSMDRDSLFWHYPRYHHSSPSSAIIAGRYKLIHFYEDGRNELYDLASDMGERFNLDETEPTLAASLQEKLNTWLDSVDAAIPQPNPNFDPNKQLIWGPRPRGSWHHQFALPE